MQRFSFLVTTLLMASGCSTVTDSESFSFTDISLVNVNVDKGTVEYSGQAGLGDVQVNISSWATASGKGKAESKQQENTYSATGADGVLNVNGDTTFVQAGIDVDIKGPAEMDLDLRSAEGAVYVRDAIGVSRLTGQSVSVTDYEGDIDIDGSGAVSAEIYPFEEGVINIVSNNGSCTVRLPPFAPLAVNITFDPEEESLFSDLGFDDEFLDNGTYIASRQPASITVNILCPNGRVELLEHSLSW